MMEREVMKMIDFKKIRRLRRAQDLSQAELGARVGYDSWSSVQKLEKGMVDIPVSRLEKLATALGVPVTELLIPEDTKSVSHQ